MSVVVIGGTEGGGQSAAAKMMALGAAEGGETVLFIGGISISPTRGVYTPKVGERIAPTQVGLIVLDEVSSDLKREIVAAFSRRDEALILRRLGAIIRPSTILAFTKTVTPKSKPKPKSRTKQAA